MRWAAQASRWLFYVIITFYVQIVLFLFICTYHGFRIPYLQKYSQQPYYSMLGIWMALRSSSFMYKAVILLFIISLQPIPRSGITTGNGMNV